MNAKDVIFPTYDGSECVYSISDCNATVVPDDYGVQDNGDYYCINCNNGMYYDM